MEINLKPTIKQDKAWSYLLDTTTKFVGFGGGAGAGKSWLICEWQLVMSIQYPGYRGYIARNELKRLMNSTFITFGKVCKYHNVPEGTWKLDGKYNTILFSNGSSIDLLDIAYKPTDPEFERFGSTEYTCGAIEEAGETHFKAFDVLKSRTGRHNKFTLDNEEIEVPPKTLLTFNPSRGWVYRIFYKPWKEGALPKSYAFVQALYKDNPHTAKEYGAQLDEIIDKTTKERLKYGNWEYDDEAGKLFRYEKVLDMFTNTIDKHDRKYMIVDVAGKGKDKTKISIWEDMEMVKVDTYTQINNDRIIELIREKAVTYKIPYSHIVVDAIGLGEAVATSHLLNGIIGYKGSHAPFQTDKSLTSEKKFTTDFKNLRSQCIFALADAVNTNKIAIKIDEEDIKDNIVDELAIITDVTKEGQKRQAVSKEDMKEHLGRSPDDSDLLQMRMYIEVRKTATGQDTVEDNGRIERQKQIFNRNKNRVTINSTR